MECSLYEKSQYVGNSKFSLNLRMNTQRNVWRADGPPCNKDFQMPGHSFNAHTKFTIIEEVYNKSLSKLKICSLLEHFCRLLDFEIGNSFPARSKHNT